LRGTKTYNKIPFELGGCGVEESRSFVGDGFDAVLTPGKLSEDFRLLTDNILFVLERTNKEPTQFGRQLKQYITSLDSFSPKINLYIFYVNF
jgi:hypothetical protein